MLPKILGIFIILLGLGLIGKLILGPQQFIPVPVENIRLGVSKAGPQLSTLIYIAQDKGYFRDNKLDVIFTTEPDSIASRNDVASGKEDLATTSDFGFVGDSFKPTNLRILAVISNSKLIEIIGRKDRGITAPSDLKGKKVALTPKSYGEFFFGSFLSLNNLKLSDVTIVPAKLDEIQEAIVSGKVDAAVTNDPFAYQIKQTLGEKAINLPTSRERNNNLLLISNENAVKTKSTAIERFLKALIQAERFVRTNPDESKQIIGKRFNLEQSFLDQNWPKNTFIVSLDHDLVLKLEDEARWSIDNELTDQKAIPNFLNYLYPDALKKVEPEKVSIIK